MCNYNTKSLTTCSYMDTRTCTCTCVYTLYSHDGNGSSLTPYIQYALVDLWQYINMYNYTCMCTCTSTYTKCIYMYMYIHVYVQNIQVTYWLTLRNLTLAELPAILKRPSVSIHPSLRASQQSSMTTAITLLLNLRCSSRDILKTGRS